MDDDLSIYRIENKYLIDLNKANLIKNDLDKLLDNDSHNAENGYMVRSLYFDTINNKDYYNKLSGTSYRIKIRLRVYDFDDKKCKLEAKIKRGNNQHKVSIAITKSDAKKLINLDYSVLLKYVKKSEYAIYLYKTMVLGCYKPVTLVEYKRIAYIHHINDTRLTLDYDIRYSESTYDLFNKDAILTPVDSGEFIVLEIKYNGKLLSYISNILKKYKLTRTAYSKYCSSRPNFYDYLG